MQLGFGDKDIDYLTAKDSYCVSWDGVDSESGVLKSDVSVCFVLDINNCLLHNLNVGNKTVICVADLEFKEGIKYVTKIRVENNVGLFTELYSDGFMIDSTPPFIGEIIHMGSSRTSFEEASEQITCTHSLIAVQWKGFLDKESGVRNFYVCVGNQPGECDIRNYTDVRNSTAYTFHNLTLVQGETYFVSVKAENRAGLTSDVKVSDGILVDKTGTKWHLYLYVKIYKEQLIRIFSDVINIFLMQGGWTIQYNDISSAKKLTMSVRKLDFALDLLKQSTYRHTKF